MDLLLPLSRVVHETVLYCLYTEEECPAGRPPDTALVVQGLVKHFGFHPGRVAEKRETIRRCLEQLSDDFQKTVGEGSSFLAMAFDKRGHQWGEHSQCEVLLALGIAAGLAGYCVEDRAVWKKLPGGMPYVWIDTKPQQEVPPCSM